MEKHCKWPLSYSHFKPPIYIECTWAISDWKHKMFININISIILCKPICRSKWQIITFKLLCILAYFLPQRWPKWTTWMYMQEVISIHTHTHTHTHTNTPGCQTQTLQTRLLQNVMVEMYQPAVIMLNVSNMEQFEKKWNIAQTWWARTSVKQSVRKKCKTEFSCLHLVTLTEFMPAHGDAFISDFRTNASFGISSVFQYELYFYRWFL